MREILFRGKSLITKEWIYGGYYCMPDCRKDEDRHIIVYQDDAPGMQTKHEPIDVETLGQFTEINDIDGDMIFDGMEVHQKGIVVGDDANFTGYVEMLEGCWVINNHINNAIPLWNETAENKIIK